MAVFLTKAMWTRKGARNVSARLRIIKSKKTRPASPAKAAAVSKQGKTK